MLDYSIYTAFLKLRRIEMADTKAKRNYSIAGPENKLAQERGLASAEWYTSPVPRQRLKELMKRKDGPAIRDTIIWLGLLIVSGIVAYHSWGTWWAIPAFLVYGLLYSTAADSRHHECSHGTPFKTVWLNEVVYHISSFMILKPATSSRWSHHGHHTDTVIVGRDPEINVKPPAWRVILTNFIRLQGGIIDLKKIVTNCFGRLNEAERVYIPASEARKAFWECRVYALILLSTIAWAISIKSILPLLFIGPPTFYGTFGVFLMALPQHLGLGEDVIDHRLNTRTIYMNFIFRFFYWNMNYHIEHHMFPMVPYHALPALHEEMKDDCPPAFPNLWSANKEVISALRKQRKDAEYCIIPPLPATARPYRFGPDPLQESTDRKDIS
jgi:fatty acid desaturase